MVLEFGRCSNKRVCFEAVVGMEFSAMFGCSDELMTSACLLPAKARATLHSGLANFHYMLLASIYNHYYLFSSSSNVYILKKENTKNKYDIKKCFFTK